ncbi:unnamed protein product [Nippostrongylus brasiliensis]|uniref:Uncharacterized protein n=1 Tax=Nippostrongylus brasiliensis TaxID=27835 RepID=A0A0N4YBI7_NIPBR|nr:unnamed protein product [Nippostrongylus brasiliensis]
MGGSIKDIEVALDRSDELLEDGGFSEWVIDGIKQHIGKRLCRLIQRILTIFSRSLSVNSSGVPTTVGFKLHVNRTPPTDRCAVQLHYLPTNSAVFLQNITTTHSGHLLCT